MTHELYPARLLCLWNFPGKNSGAGCHFILQGISLTQGSTPNLLVSCIGRCILYHCATWEAQLPTTYFGKISLWKNILFINRNALLDFPQIRWSFLKTFRFILSNSIPIKQSYNHYESIPRALSAGIREHGGFSHLCLSGLLAWNFLVVSLSDSRIGVMLVI